MKKTGYMRMLWQMLLCFMIVVSCAKDDMKVSSMDMDVVSMAEIIPDDFDTVCPGDRCFVAVLFEEDEYDFWERPMSLSLEMTEGGQLQFFLVRTGEVCPVVCNYSGGCSYIFTPSLQYYGCIGLTLLPESAGTYRFRFRMDLKDTGERIYSQEISLDVQGESPDYTYEVE